MAMADNSPDRWPAPAKINRFLHVTGRRADGYHELQTLFQLLDWGDELSIRPDRTGRVRRSGQGYGVSEAQDLVVRAAKLLQSETGCGGGVEIEVDKQIPIGAGLGGGSSDAATVLLVLNEAWDCGLSVDDLCRLGVALGADLPVFLQGRSAMASGIGDLLEPLELGQRHYVLVFPGLSIATAEIFRDPGLKRDSRSVGVADALAGMPGNDCERVVRRRYPVMDEVFQKLQRWGRPVLTGTGSTVFIEKDSREDAISSAREIKSLYNSRAVRGVDRSPVHQKLYTDGV